MMGDLPSIQQLECFIIYGRVQNFTRAAKEANITQSAFSAQMKNLESALGVTLIQRSKRGSHLTEAGKVFLARITDWMDGLHKIVYDLQSANAAQPAELNVGILRTLGDIQVNRHIAHFRQTNKNLRFNVFDLETDQICRALQDDRLDVASTSPRRTTSPIRCRRAARPSTRRRTSAGTISSTTRRSCSLVLCLSRARRSRACPSLSTRRITS